MNLDVRSSAERALGGLSRGAGVGSRAHTTHCQPPPPFSLPNSQLQIVSCWAPRSEKKRDQVDLFLHPFLVYTAPMFC